ncbi:MAG: segregation/condensation protein A [Acidobacteriia bacterium]|nr:segregation/condensation protein A [Terriglobia bacterium]
MRKDSWAAVFKPHAIVYRNVSLPLNFRLERYEGPLDLLLDLIRKQEVDIADIPISTITAQYLEYMDCAREMDVELGAEFIYMAATLIYIKSKMLLPNDPALEKMTDGEDDPRRDLVNRLMEHERFKNAAEMLQQKRLIEENVWSNPQVKSYLPEEVDPGLAVSLFDLVKAFGEVLERVKNRPVYEVESADITVSDMIRTVRERLLEIRPEEPLFILRILAEQRSRRAMIVLFLAVLELVRMQAVVVTQKEMFGEIALLRHSHFDTVFASDQPIAAIEQDYV